MNTIPGPYDPAKIYLTRRGTPVRFVRHRPAETGRWRNIFEYANREGKFFVGDDGFYLGTGSEFPLDICAIEGAAVVDQPTNQPASLPSPETISGQAQ